jgi:hypothetical protein
MAFGATAKGHTVDLDPVVPTRGRKPIAFIISSTVFNALFLCSSAPYGREPEAQEISIYWALLRLPAERGIPPKRSTSKA